MEEKNTLSPEEEIVYSIIKEGTITQLEISRHAKWLGSHHFESHLPINHEQSTLRKIRSIVRSLRLKHNAPIISSIDGYWIPKSDDEVKEYISRSEKVAKAQAKSWIETYNQMKRIFGDSAQSDYFDQQGTLFD